MKALIALEDGTTFEGTAFAGAGETAGEIVFNTGMSGYQEVLTDPSYKGQIITMTYPLIGNYGVNDEDMESAGIHASAFLIKEYCATPSNFRATDNLGAFLDRHGILGIEGIDTRALTRHIRLAGAMKGVVSTEDLDPESLTAKAKASPGLVGRDLVSTVTCQAPYAWTANGPQPADGFAGTGPGPRILVYDFGLKYNQLRLLAERGCDLLVVPAHTDAAAALAFGPDGVFLSNGPGDPAAVPEVIATIRELLGQRPMFGICLGHQLLGLALGGKTYKLKFGHRGANQPVKDLTTGKVEITSQNHGFCVDADSLPADEVEVTHVNLNDGSVEGLRHRRLAAFSVQYHPENAPGPHDSIYLFDRFLETVGR